MKTSALPAAVLAHAFLLSSLFPSGPALAQGCPTPSFGPPSAFGSIKYPVSVAVGEFNGDGKLDLAVANWGENPADSPNFRGSVSVLRGNGDGTFQAAVYYSAGMHPVSVAVGDFNRDGKLDLAVANLEYGSGGYGEAPGSVSVLLGNGDGTFRATVNYPVGVNPVSVAVSDVNGDGKPDLIVAATGSNPDFTDSGVSVLLGNGDGTFQAAAYYAAGPTARSMAVGDFNGDGKPDLAVTQEGTAHSFTDSAVSVLLGNGDGTFQPAVNYGAGSMPVSVAVGDFNGDGKPDLVVADLGQLANNPGVSVLLGNGDGTFQDAVGFDFDTTGGRNYEPLSIAVGDFNGDGKPDLVVANSQFPAISILLGNGDGTFQAAVNFDAKLGPRSVALGDFNGDGKPDLAVVADLDPGVLSGGVMVLLNTCVSTGPALSMVSSNATLTLSWPFPSTGFVLESTRSLSPPNWQPAVETPVSTNGQWLLTLPADLTERYFQLHK